MRRPRCSIVSGLQSAGAVIKAFDPVGMDEAKILLDNIYWCQNAYEAIEEADALVIITEWNEFRQLDFKRVINLMRNPILVDLRNIYNPSDMEKAGMKYICLGRNLMPVVS